MTYPNFTAKPGLGLAKWPPISMSIRLLAALGSLVLFLIGCTATETPAGSDKISFSAKTFGCGNWLTYTEDASGQFVLVLGRNDQSDTATQYSVLIKDTIPTLLTAHIVKLSQSHKASQYFCNDVVYPDLNVTETFKLTEGKIAIVKGPRSTGGTGIGVPYWLKMQATGMKYFDADGAEHTLPDLKVDSVRVGWLAG